MDKVQSIEEFYQTKMNWMPDNLKKEMGHFNVFRLDDYVGCSARPVPYSRKDFFKISLIIGKIKVHYADKTVLIDKQALLFANPMVPYNWEPLEDTQSGFFCIFTEAFFDQFGAAGPSGGKTRHIVALFASQELIDRHAQRLAD